MRPAPEVADIFRRHGPAYRHTHDCHLGRGDRRVMAAIELCRTAALGGHIETCDDCALSRVAYNSCRNRHCPKRQGSARDRWLADREADLLPVSYFHVVFTLPEPIAAIAYQNKALVLRPALSRHRRDAAHDRRRPQASRRRVGFFAVLHTWGQNLLHHPHLHCVVPGGGFSPDGTRRIACKPGFFLPVRVLSRLFRRLFLEHLEKAFDAGKLQFFSDLQRLNERNAFRRYLAPLRKADCRVGGDVAIPTPHRPGTCGIPASGSSRESFAHSGVGMNDLDWRQRAAFQDFVEAGPSDHALAISPRQPLLPNPHDLSGVPPQSSNVATNAVIGAVAPQHGGQMAVWSRIGRGSSGTSRSRQPPHGKAVFGRGLPNQVASSP
ncbi:IS91 family transposase [Rhizobium mongolense]|uniref:IS91 family transposase n=1 Tax=Rhizobium mongolense TaxID=57676 RepID=UPI003F63AAE6